MRLPIGPLTSARAVLCLALGLSACGERLVLGALGDGESGGGGRSSAAAGAADVGIAGGSGMASAGGGLPAGGSAGSAAGQAASSGAPLAGSGGNAGGAADPPLGVQHLTAYEHTCAAFANGALRCWGTGDSGRLGYASQAFVGGATTPAAAGDVNVGGPVAAVAAGGYHTCAVLMDGAVRCWGKGESGQLGYANADNVGDDESPASMGTVDVGGAVAEITAGNVHTCARLTTGAVRCWGEGVFGQHGYARASPVGDDESPASMGDVELGEPAVHIASGGLHNCALLASGAVRCWGFGEHGQLGNGRAVTIGDDESPASAGVVTVGGQVKKLGCGYRHSCALLTSGTVRCWGSADSGRLGYPGVAGPIGDDESPASAGDVPLGGLAVDLDVGSDHNCALLETGAVRCWGFAGQGKLGYGNLNDIGDDEAPANMGDVGLGAAAVQITAGLRHTCALLTSGAVRCWGAFDPLGYGNTDNIGDDELPADAGDVPLL